MSDKSNKYGYVTDVAQSFGNNRGVFSVNEVYDLVKADKWSTAGQLELIETQTSSSFLNMDFTNLGDYDVHFLTHNNSKPASDSSIATQHFSVRLSNDGGSTFIATSNYQRAYQYGVTDGLFAESKSTTSDEFQYMNGYTDVNYSGGGYIYFYNLLNNQKFSFFTCQGVGVDFNPYMQMRFGGGVLPVAETHNAIRIKMSATSVGKYSGTFSLYGYKEYS